jgi:hypothetical protein
MLYYDNTKSISTGSLKRFTKRRQRVFRGPSLKKSTPVLPKKRPHQPPPNRLAGDSNKLSTRIEYIGSADHACNKTMPPTPHFILSSSSRHAHAGGGRHRPCVLVAMPVLEEAAMPAPAPKAGHSGRLFGSVRAFPGSPRAGLGSRWSWTESSPKS